MLAGTLRGAGVVPVIQTVTAQRISAPQGDVWIDRDTLHAALTPRRRDVFPRTTVEDVPRAGETSIVRDIARIRVGLNQRIWLAVVLVGQNIDMICVGAAVLRDGQGAADRRTDPAMLEDREIVRRYLSV